MKWRAPVGALPLRLAGGELRRQAIALTQRSPLRHYERPDKRAASLDPTWTLLAGVGAMLDVQRQAGDWRWTLGGSLGGVPASTMTISATCRTLTSMMARVALRGAGPPAWAGTLQHRTRGGVPLLVTSRLEQVNHGFMLDGAATLGNGRRIRNRTWLRFGGMDPTGASWWPGRPRGRQSSSAP